MILFNLLQIEYDVFDKRILSFFGWVSACNQLKQLCLWRGQQYVDCPKQKEMISRQIHIPSFLSLRHIKHARNDFTQGKTNILTINRIDFYTIVFIHL